MSHINFGPIKSWHCFVAKNPLVQQLLRINCIHPYTITAPHRESNPPKLNFNCSFYQTSIWSAQNTLTFLSVTILRVTKPILAPKKILNSASKICHFRQHHQKSEIAISKCKYCLLIKWFWIQFINDLTLIISKPANSAPIRVLEFHFQHPKSIPHPKKKPILDTKNLKTRPNEATWGFVQFFFILTLIILYWQMLCFNSYRFEENLKY